MTPRAGLAVVIPTFRRPDRLALLLADLARQSSRPSRLVVVDGAPEGDVEGLLERRSASDPWDAWLIPSNHANLPYQRHLGWRLAADQGAEYLLFLDDDMRIEDPGAIEELLVPFAEPDVVGVTGNLRIEGQEMEPRGSVLARLFGGSRRRAPGELTPSGNRIRPRSDGRRFVDVGWLRGGVMAYRCDLLPDGWMPPELFAMYEARVGKAEDTVLSRRAGLRGRLILASRARFVHDGSESVAYPASGARRGHAIAYSRRLINDNYRGGAPPWMTDRLALATALAGTTLLAWLDAATHPDRRRMSYAWGHGRGALRALSPISVARLTPSLDWAWEAAAARARARRIGGEGAPAASRRGLALCIPTYRRAHLADRLLTDLTTQELRPSRVIVVDGDPASGDVARMLEGRTAADPWTLHHVPSSHANLPYQRYLGWRIANELGCEALLYLDDDLRVSDRAALAGLLQVLHRESGCVGVTARIDFPRRTRVAERDGLLVRQLGQARHLSPGGLTPAGQRAATATTTGVAPVEWLRGGVMLYRMESLDEACFSPHLFALFERGLGGAEDTVLSRRALAHGSLREATDVAFLHPDEDASRSWPADPFRLGRATAFSRRLVNDVYRYPCQPTPADRRSLFGSLLGGTAMAWARALGSPSRRGLKYALGYSSGVARAVWTAPRAERLTPAIDWRADALRDAAAGRTVAGEKERGSGTG